MTYKQAKRQLNCVLLVLLLLVSAFAGGRYISPVFADTGRYPSVLTDLQKDSDFDISEYPEDPQDYSIQLIQIAETIDGGLCVYTYQPCQNTTYLVATEINMSPFESVNGTNLYGLTLIKSDGVFCKYTVNNFTVSNETTRYYNITSIYREWIKGVDKEMDNDNIKNAVAFNVGKLYRVMTDNGKIVYSCKHTETVQIINPVAGTLEYSNGFKFFPDWCDSHYVAFSTDWQIDELMEADVSYIRCDASRSVGLGLDGKIFYENERSEIANLDGTQKGGNTADGWFAKKYEWERIQTVTEFLNDTQNKFSDEAKKKLDGAQWVLRFLETPKRAVVGNGVTTSFWTAVSEVTILRLKFETDGKVYNLGAVSDKVSDDGLPDNTNTNEFAGLFEWLSRLTGIPEWGLILLFIIIILVIALPLLSAIFHVVGQVLSLVFGALLKAVVWLLKALWWLVCLPFKGIAALVRKIKDKKDGG